jgi:hypothetical protein
MTALTKFVLWRVVVLTGTFFIALYMTNQALAIALLTPPPPNEASYPTALVVKVWGYLVISVVLFVFDVWLLVRTIREVNRT